MSEPMDTLLEQATPRPWRWEGSRKYGMHLSTVNRGRVFVMGFIRQGMNGAQPTFQVRDADGNGRMVPASELAVLEVPYRDDIVSIDHPDAELIVRAVNAYEPLVKALQHIAALGTDAPAFGGDPGDFYRDQLWAAIGTAARALATVESSPEREGGE